MHRFQNILVGIDVSHDGFGPDDRLPDLARAALLKARWVGQQEGGQITVLTVVEGDPAQAEAALAELRAAALPLLEGCDAEAMVATGEAHEQIMEHATRHGCDLVIVAAHRPGLVRRTVVGGTALKLLRACPCPVWVAPLKPLAGPGVVLSAVAFHRLTPLVLELSASIARLKGGQWHVLHCMEYPREAELRLQHRSERELAAYRAAARKQAWEELHGACDPLQGDGLEARLWLAEGEPHEQVADAVRKLRVDVVVLGTLGRAGLPGVILGNTAEQVLGAAECSVLAVKPPDFRPPS